jgi:hypothetical protein
MAAAIAGGLASAPTSAQAADVTAAEARATAVDAYLYWPKGAALDGAWKQPPMTKAP